MKRNRTIAAAVIALSLMAAALLGGCSVTSGVFTGMSESSTETSLSASYISFDGSFARQMSLQSGDEVTFSLSGGEGLDASVEKDGEDIFSISGGNAFTAPEDGTYTFIIQGENNNGSFSLSWEVE